MFLGVIATLIRNGRGLSLIGKEKQSRDAKGRFLTTKTSERYTENDMIDAFMAGCYNTSRLVLPSEEAKRYLFTINRGKYGRT